MIKLDKGMIYMKNKTTNVINIDLDNIDEYINKYDDNKISDDLHNYLINRAMEFDNRKKISINVKMKFKVSEKEKNKIIKLLKDDFSSNIKSVSGEEKENNVRDIYLILVGVSCIIISFMFNYLSINIASEIFLIVGWVPIWELVDNVLFMKTKEKERKRKYIQLLDADIIFK